jgi:RNA 3'-terminal phosphate cyclase (ATP)
MIVIDGSEGEGGGQILRSSLALALVTGQPFKMINIRAGRKKPGLMRQHLTAVQAAAKVGNAQVEGAGIGSLDLTFKPGPVQAGHYEFAIGTAGSVTLVLQTILPALLTTNEKSTVILEGGTHNPFAPPWDFLAKSFLPLINKMGPAISTELIKPGFFPAGGGKFSVSISPCAKLGLLQIPERGEVKRRYARALVSNLPGSIAHRELKTVVDSLNCTREQLQVVEVKNAVGPGNVIMLEIESDHVTEVFTGFGEHGVSAEVVAEQAIDEVKSYLVAGAPVGQHLADQLMLPMALAGKGCYLTMPLSQHSKTNLDVIKRFIDIKVKIDILENSNCMVTFGS